MVLGLDPPSYDGPLSSPDGATETATVDATPPNPPGKLDDPARWSTYKSQGASYVAGPFDGRFIYFIRAADDDGPDAGLTGSRILRYDTTVEKFDEPSAWTAFDPEVSVGTTGPHLAAVLDGQWLVVAGYADGIFIRFNTQSPSNDFGFASSWETFDAKGLASNSLGYDTAVPIANDGGIAYTNAGRLSALKHTGNDVFDGGWQAAPFDAGAESTFGCSATREGACVGTQLYLGPAANGTTACLARWDETKPFNEQTSWESFDINKLGEDFAQVHGTITTDRHLYFTQYNTKDAAAPVKLIRRPLNGALDAGWESQATNIKNPLTRGFIGGVFDGRFLYLSPYPVGTQNVIYTRYDTTIALADPAAWDVVAGAALGIPANRSWGAVFDGQYVYYTSYAALDNGGATFARFKAYDYKVPLPPTCR